MNEIQYLDYVNAGYLEFLEAYARVCEIASITVLFGEEDSQEITEEDRNNMTLIEKIENTLLYLLNNCTQKIF